MYDSIGNAQDGEINIASPSFIWTFELCYKNSENLGEYMESPGYLTTIGNRTIEWCLRLFKEGEDEACKGYSSLYLCASETFTAMVSFEIVNTLGASNYRKERYVLDQNRCGFRKFILKSALRESAYDKISILCRITLLNYAVPNVAYRIMIPNEEVVEDLQMPTESIVDDVVTPMQLVAIDRFKSLINDEKYSDLEIRALNGQIIKVHKCIIERSSRTIKNLLGLNRRRNFINIDDVHPDALVESIIFAYTGRIENVHKIQTMAGELLNAAYKLGMYGMKIMCEKLMCQNLRRNNVVFYSELAEIFALDELKVKAHKFYTFNNIVNEPRLKGLTSGVCSIAHPRHRNYL